MIDDPTGPRPDGAGATALERLGAQVPDLWAALAPMCAVPSPEEVLLLADSLSGYLADDVRHADHAGELGNELLAMLRGWDHYDAAERAVLVGAMRYLLTSDDVCRDTDPDGLDDDDRVVRACVRVLLRGALAA